MTGPGLVNEDMLNLDRGTNADVESGSYSETDAGSSVGDRGMADNSDRYGTGEHVTAGKDPREHSDADIDSDRIVGPEEAGLGGGLDQAEEVRLEISTEQRVRKGRRFTDD